jgi:glycosyltransferase involved in cell wall biosynthesis
MERRSPQVSVLIPVFNRPELVVPCIESALAQTFDDLEVIVVDNRSTDETWEVVQRCGRLDSRVRVFRNDTNVGPVRNWRRCLDEARAPLAKFLFSDDLIAPRFLEASVPFLEDDEIGFVYTAVESGEEPGRGSVNYRHPGGTGTISSREFRRAAVLGSRNVPVSPGCGLFRLTDLKANLVGELPLPCRPDLSSHGAGPDLLLFLLTAAAYPRLGHVDEPLAFFRSHPTSLSVDGLGGEVTQAYLLTRYWFAKAYGDVPAWRVLGNGWVSASKLLKRPATRSDLLGRYSACVPHGEVWIAGAGLRSLPAMTRSWLELRLARGSG